MPSPTGPEAATYRDFPMPQLLIVHAQDWLDGRIEEIVLPRASATVMLLRDVEPGVEVFVLHRAATMPFAPGMVAFPGGGVDPRDADPAVPWAGPTPKQWAARLDVPQDQARELVIAAARECFEECGVLLAGPGPDQVVGDLDDPVWATRRQRVLARECSFGELLVEADLVLRSDLLRLRAHWVTPACEPRRYDTHFFTARMPHGQVADGRSTEASSVRWVRPDQVLGEQAKGELLLLPPTQVMLEQLASAPAVAEVLGQEIEVWPVQPWPAAHHDAMWMRAPIGADGHGIPPQGGG